MILESHICKTELSEIVGAAMTDDFDAGSCLINNN